MSASTGALARLLEQATPGPWDTYAVGSEGHGVFGMRGSRRHRITLVGHGAWEDDKADAALIALAPDAVRLLTDMAAHIELECAEEGPCQPHCEGCRPALSLLARFAALEERAAQ